MLCIIGGGKMGQALAGGILDDEGHEDLVIVERSAQRSAELRSWIEAARYQRVSVVEDAVPAADGVVVAVKPQDVEIAVNDAASAGAKRLVSVAAGITLTRLHEWAGHRVAVIRAMPNIGALVGFGATALASGATAHEEDLVWAETILGKTGTVVRVRESQMDAVTGLSGSGPGYLFLIAEAMIDAGVTAGLTADVARQLTYATMAGAAAMLNGNPDKTPAELRSMVTTPGQTTSAGVRVLEQRAVRAAFIDAVDAATARSHELGLPSSR